jgi:hypothetical protein
MATRFHAAAPLDVLPDLEAAPITEKKYEPETGIDPVS